MGCGMSTEEKEGKQRNEEIENQLKRDKLSQRNEIKMLLLGRDGYGMRSATLLISIRRGRIGEVNHIEADETYLGRQLFPR